MSNLEHKKLGQQRRRYRIRSKISGTPKRPRLSVRISARHVSAQVIDDTKGVTLLSVTSVSQKDLPSNLTQKAAWAGTELAKKAKEAKLKKLVLDRGSKLYHGRVKALADAARKEGMEF